MRAENLQRLTTVVLGHHMDTVFGQDHAGQTGDGKLVVHEKNPRERCADVRRVTLFLLVPHARRAFDLIKVARHVIPRL